MVEKITGPFTVSSFKVGDRIELSPATDAWMMGNRFGEVKKLGRAWVRVQLDHSRQGLLVSVHPNLIYAIIP